jgi:hypothetical protein
MRAFRDNTPPGAQLIAYNVSTDGQGIPPNSILFGANFTRDVPLSQTAANFSLSALVDPATRDIVVKAVSFLNVTRTVSLSVINGGPTVYAPLATMWSVQGDPQAGNDIDAPTNVTLTTSLVQWGAGSPGIVFPPFTSAVIRLAAV